MGLLTNGELLDWHNSKQVADYVKAHAIKQFIALYNSVKDRKGDPLKWGDEIEYMVLRMDHKNKKVRVSLRAGELLKILGSKEDHADPTKNLSLWRPEYAAFQLESSPGMPYGGHLSCFNQVENEMRYRRREVSLLMEPDEILLSIPGFPRLGCPAFSYPQFIPNPASAVSPSLFYPDQVINGDYPRFKQLAMGIRLRHGGKVTVNVPIFKDINTADPFLEDFSLLGLGNVEEATRLAKTDHIYMDDVGFGDSCCGLQVTIQGSDLDEARWIYDQLTPITPLMLALSAGTPIWRGYLAESECRWNIIEMCDDDRTPEEMGLKPLKHDKFLFSRSRSDSTDCYIHPCSAAMNDFKLQYEEKYVNELISHGIDEALAAHVAHIVVRDPLVIRKESLKKTDDHGTTEHLDSIITSLWNNIRFKPPSITDQGIGWRVEFRSMEVQLTDFENAAYASFVVLLSRVIISFRLSLIIPISQVHENMQIAQRRNAVLNEKFLFRCGFHACNISPAENHNSMSCSAAPSSDQFVQMTLTEIINGKEDNFIGLVPLCRQYLDAIDISIDTRFTIEQYLGLIEKRATGEIWTLAHWMRSFVTEHPNYKRDSVVSDEITYDMVTLMNEIAEGKTHCHKLLGKFHIKTLEANDTKPGPDEYNSLDKEN